ncbi:MAG TPA: sensor histidine kinase [Stackebrandtia sp.]|jgi:signal transduction histidine kinase|uniref:sensor histidine kinase n=1 Tax=Stackebrandtia sp. TaxID=2023065 RepID=UPI002D736BCB|nr:sensor histidine kinase [Stackebrandtia sp.]HZE37315.1 sensor histidine kinase [Stackebrandtia sp.]
MTPADRRLRWQWDVPVAAVAGLVSLVIFFVELKYRGDILVPAFVGVPVVLGASAALIWRRGHPVMVAVVVGAVAVLMLNLNSHGGFVPLIVAVFALAKYGRRWIAMITGGAVIVASSASALFSSPMTALPVALWMLVWLEAGIISGEVIGRHQRQLREAQARAVEAERTREEAALRRAAEERVRIARELHDSLTHAISVVNVQSSVALHVLERQPAQAEAALRNIREASRDAMRELRATLRALRVADPAQAPGVATLSKLLEQARQSGLDVEMHVDGQHRALGDTVDRTVFRIVQESLTNITRHSAATRVDITMQYGVEDVSVHVVDNGGIITEPITEGLGLSGMRERVAALGGSLRAQPVADGGFEVRAQLPTTGERAEAKR